jgi:hypothetical protein
LICSGCPCERASRTERKRAGRCRAVVKILSYQRTCSVIDLDSRERYRVNTEIENSASDLGATRWGQGRTAAICLRLRGPTKAYHSGERSECEALAQPRLSPL